MDNDLIDMIASDNAQSDVHDKIKEILYAKSQENINAVTPSITAGMFGGQAPTAPDEAPDLAPSSVEDTTEVEAPTAEVDAPDDEKEEEKPEA